MTSKKFSRAGLLALAGAILLAILLSAADVPCVLRADPGRRRHPRPQRPPSSAAGLRRQDA